MERGTKEKIATVATFVLLSALNGAAGARVLYSLLDGYFKKRDDANKRRMISEQAFRVMLSRLKKQGIVESGGWGIWRITKKGRAFARDGEEKRKAYEHIRRLSQTQKNTIVIFDVPEKRRKLRDYLRTELVDLGYEQLQKSVWIGAGPLPAAFMDFIKEKELLDTVHIFIIATKGTIKI